jgi:hypothetical protein
VDYFADSVKLVVLSVPVGRVPGDLPTEAPLRVARSGSSLALTWSATCVGTDVDFGVYEGSLGSFTSHVPVQCTTGGATSTTFTPADGNRYYLVVATNGFEDGSYGLATGSTERPQSASACNPQHLAEPCP